MLTTPRTYDKLNRLRSIGSGAMQYEYEYNAANQRVRVERADGSYWLYGRDDLGQVTSGIEVAQKLETFAQDPPDPAHDLAHDPDAPEAPPFPYVMPSVEVFDRKAGKIISLHAAFLRLNPTAVTGGEAIDLLVSAHGAASFAE